MQSFELYYTCFAIPYR